MNNDQEIILAKISAVYDKPPFVKMETGQMEMILKCVGLGAYYDKYREYLEPYWYNGRFQNPVESYRIFVGLNSIFEDLLNERKGDEIISLLTELGNYIPGTILSDEARFAADFNKLRQLYNGTHRLEGTVEVAKNEDALMMIRMTTDILVWIYQKHGMNE